jgi:RimJ/RimL family protein N-acetyltransferase
MPDRPHGAHLWIEPWTAPDLDVLRRVNTPWMKRHVGGPETDEQLLVRHHRYLDFAPSGQGRMFTIRLHSEREAVGTVGYAAHAWRQETVYEMGWNVLPPFQGCGIASEAAALAVTRARTEHRHRYLHAFPSVDNPASNAVCRKAGFSLVSECDFEFPPGRFMRSNDWSVDLDEAV